MRFQFSTEDRNELVEAFSKYLDETASVVGRPPGFAGEAGVV
jgi:hypothetical protein